MKKHFSSIILLFTVALQSSCKSNKVYYKVNEININDYNRLEGGNVPAKSRTIFKLNISLLEPGRYDSELRGELACRVLEASLLLIQKDKSAMVFKDFSFLGFSDANANIDDFGVFNIKGKSVHWNCDKIYTFDDNVFYVKTLPELGFLRWAYFAEYGYATSNIENFRKVAIKVESIVNNWPTQSQ